MKRMYQAIIEHHFNQYEQMAFLSGPRQVGKTTIANACQQLSPVVRYLNWDKLADRELLLTGLTDFLDSLPVLNAPEKPIIVFDEIHKYKDWKNLIKGIIDEYKKSLHILVTGSAELNVYKHGSDSLSGRYFLYRVHPVTVAEFCYKQYREKLINAPMKISDEEFNALFEFGGFPEPLLKQDKIFYNRWQNLRQQQLFREDIRDLEKIQELAQLEVLANILRNQAGGQINYSSLAKKIRVSDQTIRRWMSVLEIFYYGFTIKPWSNNISRSLLKEPKFFLWDWSMIKDKGKRIENFIACHLLKAVHCWTDLGLGKFELYFLRDKEKREVDFLVVQDEKPWLMLEVKSSAKEPLSKSLAIFQQQLNAKHVLQVAFDSPYEEYDCFKQTTAKIVSARTFLSQLV